MESLKIKLLDSRLGKAFPMPTYATEGSAGLDLRACVEDTLVIPAGGVELISTGLSLNMEDAGYAAILLPRSGLGHKHGIILGNTVGLIDSDYRGPVMVSCWNRSNTDFTVEPGDRIAQMIIVPVVTPSLVVIDELNESTRGSGGFGSTGVG